VSLLIFCCLSHYSLGKKKSKTHVTKPKAKPKPPPAPAPSISAYRPAVSAEQEQDFMSSILGTMDNIIADPLPKKVSRKRKPSPVYDSDPEPSPKRPGHSSYRQKPTYAELSSDGPMDEFLLPSSDGHISSPNKRIRIEDVTMPVEGIANLDVYSGSSDFDTPFDDIDMDAFNDLDSDVDMKPVVKKEIIDVHLPKKSSTKSTALKKEEEPDFKPAWLSVYDSLAVETEDTLGPLSTATTASNLTNISALETDGSLRFFWLDYLELDGKLYFIGKLKDKSSGEWISCCVTVEGIERNLFVLPREKRVEVDDDGNIHETDIVPTQDDIDDDFDLIRKQMKIKSYRGKFVKRKYAFGEKDIPRGESTWMKVVYGFNGKLNVV
jgi:DNA polymerase alpha subunit A